MNPTQNRKNPERDPAGSSKRVKVKQEVAPRTHLLTAVPSNSPNSLCWLGLVSAGLSRLGWITEGSDWDSGLAPAGSASARWFRSSVRRQVLVSLAGMGVSGVFSCSWRCSCSRTGRTSAAPVLVRRSSAGGRGGTVASLLWNDGLREYSGIGPAHPGEERKRGRKSGRRWRGEEEGGQDVGVGEEKKKTCEEVQRRWVQKQKWVRLRCRADEAASGCLGYAKDASPDTQAAHANSC